MAAGFYHTLILSVNSDASSSQGWDEGFMLPFVPTKTSSLFGTSGTGGLSNHNLLEEASHSHNDLRSVLLNGGAANRESTVLAVNSFVKDAAIFAGTNQTTQQASMRQKSTTKLSHESKSKISTRDLLIFLTNHIETLVSVDTQINDLSSMDLASGKAFDEALSSLRGVFSCIVTMLEISRRTIEDSPQSNSKLPISQDDALNFFHKMIRIVSLLLKRQKKVIAKCIDKLLQSNCKDVFDSDSLSDLSLSTLLEMQEADSSEHKSVSFFMMKNLGLCQQSHTPKRTPTDEGDEYTKFYSVISKLRFTLLSTYLSMRVDDDRRSKYVEVLTDIGTILSKFGKVFFPNPELFARYFEALQRNVVAFAKPVKSVPLETSRSFHTLNLRLLSLSSSVFRSSEEVVRIFQRSKLHGLHLFRTLLSLYNHFSIQTLERKIQQQTGNLAGVSTGAAIVSAVPAVNTDVRRLMSLLEHCITNFVKCAVPIIFASSLSVPQEDISDVAGSDSLSTSMKQHLFGVEILKEVLYDAVAVIDFLLLPQQPLSEDIMNQVRYGTVMPSILPSILIFGMSFTKYGCIIMDIIPNMRNLIKKLQLFGKSDIVNSTSPTKGSVAISEKNKLPTSFTGSKDDDVVNDGLFDEMQIGNGKKDVMQISWWFRLLKLSANFAANMASRLVFLPQKRIQLSISMKNHSINSIDNNHLHENDLVAHRLWNFLSLGRNCADVIEQSMKAYFLVDKTAEELIVPDTVKQICTIHRDEEKKVDPMYRMLSQSGQGTSSNSIFHEIEEVVVEVIYFLCGYEKSKPSHFMYSAAFKLISRMIKHIHSRRSVLVSGSDGLSWVEILHRICHQVKIFCRVLLQGEARVLSNIPLLLPLKGVFKSDRVYQAWRRAMMIIACLSRWKICVKNKMKDMATSVVDFISVACSTSTKDYSVVDSKFCAGEIHQIFESFTTSNLVAFRYSSGIESVCLLMEEVSSVSMKCDVLCALIPNLKAVSRISIDRKIRKASGIILYMSPIYFNYNLLFLNLQI